MYQNRQRLYEINEVDQCFENTIRPSFRPTTISKEIRRVDAQLLKIELALNVQHLQKYNKQKQTYKYMRMKRLDQPSWDEAEEDLIEDENL